MTVKIAGREEEGGPRRPRHDEHPDLAAPVPSSTFKVEVKSNDILNLENSSLRQPLIQHLCHHIQSIHKLKSPLEHTNSHKSHPPLQPWPPQTSLPSPSKPPKSPPKQPKKKPAAWTSVRLLPPRNPSSEISQANPPTSRQHSPHRQHNRPPPLHAHAHR